MSAFGEPFMYLMTDCFGSISEVYRNIYGSLDTESVSARSGQEWTLTSK
jgi:hypothetical protein